MDWSGVDLVGVIVGLDGCVGYDGHSRCNIEGLVLGEVPLFGHWDSQVIEARQDCLVHGLHLAVDLLVCGEFFCQADELAHGDAIELVGPADDLQCLVFEGGGVEEGFAKLMGSIVGGEILFRHLFHKILPDFEVTDAKAMPTCRPPNRSWVANSMTLLTLL